MATALVPVPTVRARLLPGWMTRDQAMAIFTNECVPSRTTDEATAIWQEYQDRASALPMGRGTVCTQLPLTQEEQTHALNFINFLNQFGPHQVAGIVKVDLREVIVHQLQVVTERSEAYAQSCQTEAAWLNELLPTAIQPAQFGMQVSIGPPLNPHPLSSQIIVDLPHSECAFLPVGQTGMFRPDQLMRYVTACDQGTKIMLKAGYHRSFARFASAPPAIVPTAVVALERNTWTVPVNQPPTGVGVIGGTAGLHFSGIRPALLSDFFTDGLFMDVLLRRKRYQLRIQSTWVALDDV
jgi:hypothetical protein